MAELRTLTSIYHEYQEQVNFVVVSEDLTESTDRLESFKERQGWPGNFYVGNLDILEDFRIFSQASKVVVDRNGIIAAKEGFGAQNQAFWRGVLDSVSGS